MRPKLRLLLLVIAMGGIGLLVAAVAARSIKPSISYSLLATFEEMPADDVELQRWLEDQPGVYRAVVTRRDERLEIVFGMSRDLTGRPPLPDFEGNFERLGYRGLSEFRDFRD